MRLIDADALLKRYDENHIGPPGAARKLIEDAPTMDLIRCKDCKHRDPEDRKCDCGGMPWDTQVLPVPDDWYCPNGFIK